jgi:hypothetical protein
MSYNIGRPVQIASRWKEIIQRLLKNKESMA